MSEKSEFCLYADITIIDTINPLELIGRFDVFCARG